MSDINNARAKIQHNNEMGWKLVYVQSTPSVGRIYQLLASKKCDGFKICGNVSFQKKINQNIGIKC